MIIREKFRISFSLRTIFFFTTVVAFFLASSQMTTYQCELIHNVGSPSNICLDNLGDTFMRGWPMVVRTDQYREHPSHKSGSCEFDSIYHPVGIAVNLSIAVIASIVVFVLPQFIAWRNQLRRERIMIDNASRV